jgi:tetratricopeptide (TPR) repeat protein
VLPQTSTDPAYRELRDTADRAFRDGDPRQALQWIARAIDRAPAVREPYERASAYWSATGDDLEAARFFEITAKLAPDAPWPSFYRGFHLFRAGQWDGALAAFEAAEAIAPDTPEFRFRLGLVLQATGEFDRALPHLRAAAESDPDDPVFADRYARLLRITGDYAGARRVVDRALATSPLSAVLQAALGELCLRAGELEAAERALREAARLDPGHREAHLQLSRLLAAAGRSDEAERFADRAARISEYREAAAAWAHVAASEGADPRYALALADLELTDGNPAAALQWADRAEVLGADPDRVRCLRAESLYATKDLAGGDRELASLARPDGPWFELARSRGFLARDDRERALRALDAARDQAPADRVVLRRLGDLYRSIDRPADADACRRRAVTVEFAVPLRAAMAMASDDP